MEGDLQNREIWVKHREKWAKYKIIGVGCLSRIEEHDLEEKKYRDIDPTELKPSDNS